MKKIVTSICLLLACSACRAQSFNVNLANMLQDTLTTYLGLITNIKGMSASVYIPEQGTWQGVGGLSHIGVPITKNMSFGVASNTKLFVATTMLLLAENNIISLDDAIHKWLPNYRYIDSNITVRQLLNHTSGISDPIFSPPWSDTIMANPTRVFTPREVLTWLGPPLFIRGQSWGYSNVNYILAGMVAEAATGQHISKLIRDSIFTPLNMDSSFYDVEEAERGIIAHRWWNNVDFNDTSRIGLNSAGGAAGNIFSTSSEMAQWYNALFTGRILNQKSLGEITPHIKFNSVQDYGLGLTRETTQGRTYWGHGGDTWGYRSKMMYDSCNGVVVCGLSNSWPSGMSSVTFLLYRAVKNHIPGCGQSISGAIVVCQGQKSVTYTVSTIDKATSYQWTLPAGVTGSSTNNTITVNYGVNALSGMVKVSGVNSFGPGGSATLWVTVNPTPPAPVISQQVDTLNSNAVIGNQWYNSSGPIAGANKAKLLVTVKDLYYSIVSLKGCESDTSNKLNVKLSGLNAKTGKSAVLVYPNPVDDILHIEIEGGDHDVQVEVVNAIGQSIYSDTFFGITSIPTQQFISGVYTIKLGLGDTVELIKLVKE